MLARICRQMLGDLEESFNSLEQGSKGMLSQVRTVSSIEFEKHLADAQYYQFDVQAQRLAAQQSGKRWFGY